MKARLLLSLCSVLALTSASCSKDSAPSTTRPAGAASAEHAPAEVRPGSHEDWCGEHGVPESQCTRCNPELIPAFKATKDWCEEHALPESQCLLCHPELRIVRPPKGG